MLYAIWQSILGPVKNMIPYSIRKRKLNFISIHYVYLITMAMLGSIIIVATGGIKYIDSLFFASGSATQSGLNTVDMNKINTCQQLILYLLAMICNPIAIHSSVVFIRLYWFEKRFQHIVREAKTLRRTKSKSRTNTMGKDDAIATNMAEMGVRGRKIMVIHNNPPTADQVDAPKNEDSESSSPDLEKENREREETEINQADRQDTRGSGDDIRLPQQISSEHHIAFLENQRNPRDATTLRIPSPREFDRGGKPEAVDDEDEENLQNGITKQVTSPSAEGVRFQNMDFPGRPNTGEQLRSHITIDEPNIRRTREKTGTFPRLGSNARTEANDDPPNSLVSKRSRRGTFSSMIRSYTTQEKDAEPMPYLSWEPTIGRNSMFVNLTEEQREELGGIEYRALKTLAVILITYFFAFHIFGAICLIPWILNTHYGKVVTDIGQGRVWWGIFTSASAFNDLGFTLTPDSMYSFEDAIFPLLLMTFLIVIGNTGFPCMLRFVIWLATKFVPRGSSIWEELHFLLDHPRRCFTLLFPRGATWWLFAILVVLNGLDLIFFIILDLNDSTVTSIPPGLRFVAGLFQASSTRTAGFAVVNLSDLHPAIQVSYLIMMYISVFPIAISMRRTNVYEEKSLGIYAPVDEEEEDSKEPSYVGAHLRRQLSFDLWYIFLGMFVIAIAEGDRLENTNQPSFTLFSVLFEIVSAYGTVGLSLGYPTVNTSLSGEFNTISKLVIIAMQIRGRHRGLPYELDRAILLPSESLHMKEAAEAERQVLRRRGSNTSQMSAVTGSATHGPFRTETGLSTSSATGAPGIPARDRRTNTVTTARSAESGMASGLGNSHLTQHLPKGPRTGLGNVMFKVANHPAHRNQEEKEEPVKEDRPQNDHDHNRKREKDD
ncbi:putative potassium ion transporter [Phaeomoniella chlamydospora]|uniref:Potassium transport protein n=1 Tax=Phaeomoniella chlamydospora TaxID=158046 RepID=A0A0G2EJV8_PHACM|nr:putative potassium ion transporter [Phaeomoniella chlamydospora]